MSFISYAQNFEDIMLWRALNHIPQGFYIDAGACEPENYSVTKAFYDAGWSGINIEPVEKWHNQLLAARPRDINLRVAAGAAAGEITFYEMPDTGLSTTDLNIAEYHENVAGYKKKAYTVPVQSISHICKKYDISIIHFLKIDVEGAEKDVLKGVDFSKIKPWIILVESTIPSTRIANYQNWESILLGNGYEFVYFDGLNRFYVDKERAELKEAFALPPGLYDDFYFARELNARKELIDARKELIDARKELIDAKKELIDANEALKNVNNILEGTKILLAQSQLECRAVYNSTFWRLTYPFRQITQYIKKTLLKNSPGS